MSNDAQPASGGATYRMLRELGARSQHSFAALRESHRAQPTELVVAQRFVRLRGGVIVSGAASAETATVLDGEAMALVLHDARCLAKNWHPNIARVKFVDLAGPDRPELTVATELLDGATLTDLFEAAHAARAGAHAPPAEPHPFPLPVLVRILLDVLTGVHALHHLRDAANVPLGAIHGALCPANVVVGKDGVARIVNVLRARPVHVDARSEAIAYAAPEAIEGEGTSDPRADVYAVGVMLWEGITGLRLYEHHDPTRVPSRQRADELTPPSLPPTSPFARLSYVAMRALAFDPALRFRSAADMAAELRKVADARLASGSAVAACVAELAGHRIRTRRSSLEPALSGTRRRASATATLQGSKHSDVMKASMQRVVPTLEAEVPLSLIAASRAGAELEAHDGAGDEPADDGGHDADALPEPPVSGIEATHHLISTALAAATAKMRAVALERASEGQLPSTGTPGDFVIPIEVTETFHEGRARAPSRRGLVFFTVAGAVALLAMGSFVALRTGATSRGAARLIDVPTTTAPLAAPAPPPATTEAPPPGDATAIKTTPVTRASGSVAPPSVVVTAPVPVPAATDAPSTTTTTSAATAGASASANARPASPAPPPPPAKPKKSLYDPSSM